MDSGSERDLDREKDLIRRSKILYLAQNQLKEDIINAENLNPFTASRLAIDFASYELEDLEQKRQTAFYLDKLPSEIEKTDKEIEELKEILDESSRGHFSKLKLFMQVSIDRIKYEDQAYADFLRRIFLRIPLTGKGIKRATPSYLDERFNQIKD